MEENIQLCLLCRISTVLHGLLENIKAWSYWYWECWKKSNFPPSTKRELCSTKHAAAPCNALQTLWALHVLRGRQPLTAVLPKLCERSLIAEAGSGSLQRSTNSVRAPCSLRRQRLTTMLTKLDCHSTNFVHQPFKAAN